MKKTIQIRNKEIAIKRWNNVYQKIKDHVSQIPKEEYLLHKSRLLGYISGDGSIRMRPHKNNKNHMHYEISFYPDDLKMAKKYQESILRLYLKETKRKDEGNHFSIRFKHKYATIDLIKEATLGTNDWKIPDFVINNNRYLKEWLKAFYDSEAYVSEKVVRVESVNQKGIEQIKKCLEQLGIKPRQYKYIRKQENWQNNHILIIARKEDRKKFLNEIGFYHGRKLKKLKEQFLLQSSNPV